MLRRILVVDDGHINRQLLKKILSGEYVVLEAENGKVALDMLKREGEGISAVLLDLIMPEMSGYELLQIMRDDEALSSIPVIITTSSGDVNTEVRTLSLGANDFIAKPYNPAVIKQRLRNTINLRETAAYINALQRDKLTGLYSRETFFSKVEEMVAEHEAGYYVMSFFNITNFKVINDQYGNAKGDEVLKMIADILRNGFDPAGGICSRITADRFAMLYPRTMLESPELDDIRERIALLDGSMRPISFSVGRYIVTDLTLTGSAMYDRAAMAEASVRSRFDVSVAQYDESMRESLMREQAIIGEMKAALDEDQFEVWLQPQYNHSSGALIGAEALARWRHPERGLLPPGAFIPVFERNGFIYEMDKYIWRRTCALLRKWIDEELDPLPVSVNVSRYDIFREDFFESITGFIAEYEVPLSLLNLEITESAFAKSMEQIIGVVKRLLEYGFTVEIDDFGSGYSSLNTLKDVPADVLKLDMRFLDDTDNTTRGGNILESIVRMAKWLGMPIIAEGVETKAQADYLRSIGCFYVQGYLYARPMPAEEYERLLRSQAKERNMKVLETVDTLDNDAFWDPNSMETLIFNSYVGGACIFEYHNGNIEILRVNEKYAREFGIANMTIEDALELNPCEFMDEKNVTILRENIATADETDSEASCEVVLKGVNGHPADIYLRATMRVIARTADSLLMYCSIYNNTAQREAERQERMASDQMRTILNGVTGGVSAVTLDDEGVVRFIFANEQYYAMRGYDKAQFENEVSNVFELIHPLDRRRVQRIAQRVLASDEPAEYEYRLFKRDGGMVYIQCNTSATDIEGIPLRVLLNASTDITPFIEANMKLRETGEQLSFLNDTAHDLLAQPDIDAALDLVLGKILEHFGADRAYVIELNHDKMTADNTYEVVADGVKSEMEKTQNLHRDSMPYWWESSFDDENYISIKSVDDLDDSRAEERRILLEQGVTSLIAAPLNRDGMRIGFIGVDNPSKRQRNVRHLEALGDYVTVMLTRRDLNARIESDNQALFALMNDTPGGFVRMREMADNSVIPVYINDGFCKLVGMSMRQVYDEYADGAINGVHPDDRVFALAAIDEMKSTGETRGVRFRLKNGEGGYVWVMVFGRMTLGSKGDVFFNVYYTDLSQREEQELSFREMVPIALNAMMASSTDLAFVKDKDLTYICATGAFARMAGLDSEVEIVGKTDYDLFEAKLANKYRADDMKLMKSGKSLVDYVEHLPSNNGQPRYCTTSKYLLNDSDGNIIGVYGTARDITESREALAQLKLLTNTIPGGLAMYEVSPDSVRILFFNDGFYQLSGYTKDEFSLMAKKDAMCLVWPEDVAGLREKISAMLTKQDSFEHTYRANTKGGGYRWVMLRGNVLERFDNSALVNTVKLDVTKQIEADEEIRVREREYELAIEHSGRYFYRYHHKDGSVDLPESTAKLFDLPRRLTDVPKAMIADNAVADESLEEYEAFYRAIRQGDKTGSMTILRRVASGEYRWIRARFSNVYNDAGKPVSAIIMLEDVTRELERDTQTAQSRESERVWKLVATHSNRVIFRYDIPARTASAHEEEMSKIADPELLKDLPESLIKKGYIMPESVDEIRRVFRRIHDGVPSGEAKLKTQIVAEKPRWVDMKFSTITDDDDQPRSAVISLMDVTDEHERELAYSRYLHTISRDTSSEDVLFYSEADVTQNIAEKYGGNVFSGELPPAVAKRSELLESLVSKYIVREERDKCHEFFSRDHLITAFSDGKRSLEAEWTLVPQGGEPIYVRSELQMVQDPYTMHIKSYTIIRDITRQKLQHLAVRRSAELDGMTGLYNKATTEALIRKRLADRDRGDCALIVADLDNLKAINDMLGHDQGDKAIMIMAKLLREQFRKNDIVGRIGGDEFLVFLEGGFGEERLKGVMTSFMRKLSAVRIGEHENAVLHSSIGVAISESKTESYEDLFKKADKALYNVKRNGKADFAFYTPDMEATAYKHEGHQPQSIWRRSFIDARELYHLLKAVSSVYDTVVSANLTDNSYCVMRYDDYMTDARCETGDYDDFIIARSKLIHPDDRELFLETFSRESLLAAGAQSDTPVSFTGRRMSDNGEYVFINSQVVFINAQDSGDVFEITLVREV